MNQTRVSRSLKPNYDGAGQRETQNVIWRFADALARGLREPSEGDQGDSRWTVSGLGNSVWEIKHPDFESLGLTESPLRLRIKQLTPGKWVILTQNNLKNLQSTNTLAVTEELISRWNLDEFSKSATVYFKEQKKKIDDMQADLKPQMEPGATAPPTGGGEDDGMGGPPMGGAPTASRNLRARQEKSKLGEPREFGSSVEASSEARRLKDKYPSLNLSVMKVPQKNKYVICIAGKTVKASKVHRRIAATIPNLQQAERIAAFLRGKYKGKPWLSNVTTLNDRHGVGVEIRTAKKVSGLPVALKNMPIIASVIERYTVYVQGPQVRAAITDLQGIGVENYQVKPSQKNGIMAIHFEATEEEFDRIHELGVYDLRAT